MAFVQIHLKLQVLLAMMEMVLLLEMRVMGSAAAPAQTLVPATVSLVLLWISATMWVRAQAEHAPIPSRLQALHAMMGTR